MIGILFAESDQLLQGGGSVPMQLLVLLTLLAVLPGILLTVTGFARILIVLGFLRTALGTPSIPPNQVLVGIAFFLSLFVMAPTMNEVRKAERARQLSEERTSGYDDQAVGHRSPWRADRQ